MTPKVIDCEMNINNQPVKKPKKEIKKKKLKQKDIFVMKSKK